MLVWVLFVLFLFVVNFEGVHSTEVPGGPQQAVEEQAKEEEEEEDPWSHVHESLRNLQDTFEFGTEEQGPDPVEGDYYKGFNVSLPEWADNLANVWDPIKETDTPYFWFIPRSGTNTLMNIFSYCMGFAIANHRGPYIGNRTVGVYKVGGDWGQPHRPQFINVRTDSVGWIFECHNRRVIESQLSDVFVSPFFNLGARVLFSDDYKGRGFMIMRHPVKRVVDEFYFHQHATWRDNWDANRAAMSLRQYVKSEKMIENFVTRSILMKKKEFDISPHDLRLAKEILRAKVFVGVFEWFDASVVRFEKLFGWWDRVETNLTINSCHSKMVRWGDHIGNHPFVYRSEDLQETIMQRNWADVELYHYVKNLFTEQSKLLA